MNRWVAIKIPTADSSSNSKERKTLYELEQYAKKEKQPLRSFHITGLLEHFIHKGPNGCHDCVVMPLLGPSVGYVLKEFRAHVRGDENEYHELLGPSTIWRMSICFLKAVTFVHKCGFTHRGNNKVLFLKDFLCIDS